MKRLQLLTVSLAAIAGCANQRGEEGLTVVTGASAGADETGADDGSDPGDETGDTGAVDDGDPGDGSTSGGGDESTTGAGDGDDGPADDGGVSDEPPNCGPYYSEWPTDASAEPPRTRDEMWCYINRKRYAYTEHGRHKGWPGNGESHNMLTWPYAFEWDAAITADAQALADQIQGGAQPPGMPTTGGFGAKQLYIDGLNTTDYILSTVDDYEEDWWDPTPCCHDPQVPSGISNSNGAARQGLYYHDPGGDGPVLTRLGVGMAEDPNGARVWVAILRP